MALRDQPYIPLYVQDYLTDEKLNMCSASTQGVYIKIMCVFHKSECYGGILLKQKDKQNSSTCLNFALKLARLLPFNLPEIESAINELLDENVLSIDGDFLYQKRMVRDNEISMKRANSGKKGGKKTQDKNKEFALKLAKDFAKAKNKANTEYEYEYEYKNILPEIWKIWIDYKYSQFKFKFKSKESEQIAINQLIELSGNNNDVAHEYIKYSISQGYKGIFKPNNKIEYKTYKTKEPELEFSRPDLKPM